ncbi:hypothetical protein WS86_15140 [Burkholderia savannae]|uniref:hypothetical protein n=1 Tax=Burkholderia savannae TaxID=1637837 RepID=UPI00075623BA|nr:hypothetical protein [Burkholderia savannae]AOJ81813.1 hypothetical protein WS86_15140 [Burkholderia savannae]
MAESENITRRVREFIRYFPDYNWFEELTGVRSSKWRDLDREKTKAATAEMIEGVCSAWPEFAYWFVTGTARSPRGQLAPLEYFDWEYGEPGAFEPGEVSLSRDASGQLSPELGHMNIKDKRTEQYELSVAERVLRCSCFVNDGDAKRLARRFWESFIQRLRPSASLTLTAKSIKNWVDNQYVDQEK